MTIIFITGCIAKKETASVVDACVICSIITRTIKFSGEIRVQRGIWQKWKDFNDHFDYYIYRANFHSVICIQRRDTQVSLAIDLVVDSPSSVWYIRVRETEWKPGNRSVYQSRNKWHAAAALKALQPFIDNFKWDALCNNCSTFIKEMVGYMGNDEKREDYECEPITDDFDKLSSFGESLGIELMYINSRELEQKSLPSQDEGREEGLEYIGEHINDGPIHQTQVDEDDDTSTSNRSEENRNGKNDEGGLAAEFKQVGEMDTYDKDLMNVVDEVNNEG